MDRYKWESQPPEMGITEASAAVDPESLQWYHYLAFTHMQDKATLESDLSGM
ncbi:hypothetical protein IJT17_10070 [bacterium]|nr:hypothetical protein [bacterium]